MTNLKVEIEENVNYKLTGYRPNGISYTVPREEIGVFRNGHWYPINSNKIFVNFVIERIEIIK